MMNGEMHNVTGFKQQPIKSLAISFYTFFPQLFLAEWKQVHGSIG